jgi:hypothetical protein
MGLSLDVALLAVLLGADVLVVLLCDAICVFLLDTSLFDVVPGFSASGSLVEVTRLVVLGSEVDN